jgi:hypothetical protein
LKGSLSLRLSLLSLLLFTLLLARTPPPAEAAITLSGYSFTNAPASDLIWDPGTARVYASVPGSAGSRGNTITPIDPVARTVGTSVFVGSEPKKLARSDNGQYLYVGLDGAGAVRRFDLASQTAGLQFSLGADPTFGGRTAEDIAVMPGTPGTVAVARKYTGLSPRHAGVAIFDNGVQRTTTTPGHIGSNSITFGGSPSALYGLDNESSGGAFRRMTVSAGGVSIDDVTQVIPAYGVQTLLYKSGRVYATNGGVIDPTGPSLVGTFVPAGTVHAVAPNRPRVYFLSPTSDAGTYILHIFDSDTFTQVASFQIVTGLGYQVSSLITWGTNGIAFRTSANQIFFFTIQGDTATTPPATMTSPASGATLAGASQLFNWTAASGATGYAIYAGSATGAYDYFSSLFSGTSGTITGLPTNGAIVYIRLWTNFSGEWLFNDYQYNAPNGGGGGGSGPAAMTSPPTGLNPCRRSAELHLDHGRRRHAVRDLRW